MILGGWAVGRQGEGGEEGDEEEEPGKTKRHRIRSSALTML